VTRDTVIIIIIIIIIITTTIIIIIIIITIIIRKYVVSTSLNRGWEWRVCSACQVWRLGTERGSLRYSQQPASHAYSPLAQSQRISARNIYF
jgi:hypothetical protein